MTPVTSSRILPAKLEMDLTGARPVARRGGFHMGAARSPDGEALTVDSVSLLRNGRPWLPTMGEFHYARFPQAEWRRELLKMRAGGIDLLASYVFWIHHEEVEGRFDWSGRRNLRRFVQLAGEVGLLVVVRCGPWCHGEVRHGGLPDWVLPLGKRVRSDDPAYLGKIRTLYAQIAAQIRGLLWKDGGPVVGVQVENEYGGPAEHLLTLKRLACEAGLDVPLYTRTGWPELATPMPFGHLLPLHGGYVEGFWDRSLDAMPGNYWRAFTFTPARADGNIATDHFGVRDDEDDADTEAYPYLTCELGGGMMNSYHRRIRIDPRDIHAAALCKLGAGSNLPGYYMYHGGVNPDGALSTLHEAQATQHTNYNDLPVKGYDFQAPLGAAGQTRPHYHLLRRLHLFLRDFGSDLTRMPSVLPSSRPEESDDTDTLRWAVRTDGTSGYVFVNNYQRLQPMETHGSVQFHLRLRDEAINLPTKPVAVPAGASFFWPFNLDLAGVRLAHATAQPICRLDHDDTTLVVFAAIPGVSPEFVFDRSTVAAIASGGEVTTVDGHRRVHGIEPGRDAIMELKTTTGAKLSIVVLDEVDALACWKVEVDGREVVLITAADVLTDDKGLRLLCTGPAETKVAMLPAPRALRVNGEEITGTPVGPFTSFALPTPPANPGPVVTEPIQPAGPPRTVTRGRAGVAEAPSDADFANAAAWRIRLPAQLDRGADNLLRIHCTGDVARLYLDDTLIIDDHCNGSSIEINLRHHAPRIYDGDLVLKVLPLRQDAPVYFSDPAARAAASTCTASADVVVRHELALQFQWNDSRS